MDNILTLIHGLHLTGDKYGYKCFKKLEAASEHDNSVYQFFDLFVEMIDNNNLYIRARGKFLIAANVKCD